MAPGLVASPSDLVEYYIENAEPVKPDAPKGFLERHIHSELMRRYPTVNSVIHSHAPDTIPFGVTDIPMRPCSSLAGFLGASDDDDPGSVNQSSIGLLTYFEYQ